MAGVAMSWLWVWWLDYGERRNAKRAIVFLSILGVMVAGNGVTAAAVVVRWGESLGLRGAASPEDAVLALTANSCLFTHDWHHLVPVLMNKTSRPQRWCPSILKTVRGLRSVELPLR